MRPTKLNSLAEREVVRVWQHQMQYQRLLKDTEGRPVKIIYPGRLNDGRGGDFRDAVISAGDIYKSGDIEIHTRASGWQAHGHHRDPSYNSVVLHVALEPDRAGETVLENGQSIPTIILDQSLSQSLQDYPAQSTCQRITSDPEYLLKCLDRAGEKRFFTRASRYRDELNRMAEGQSLYQGIMEALGYTKNQKPFLELAHRVPLHSLEEIINTGGREQDILASLQAYLLCKASGLPWELFKVRPDNSPRQRILALSYLVYRYREHGWLPALTNILRRTPADRMCQELESAFIVNEKEGPMLLGRARASEIVINVFLPFAWSWSRKVSNFKLKRKVMDVFRHYPRLESNSIERHMLQQLSLERRQVNSACRQQGLIHIYKTLCTQGKCGECVFNCAGSLRDFSRS